MMMNRSTENGMTLRQLSTELTFYLVPNTVVLSLYLLTSLIGNSTVMIIYTLRIKANRDDRFFIPYLALFDMLSTIMGTSFAIALNSLPLRFSGDDKCKVLWFFTMWTTLTSAMMLIVIAIQRYLKVCRPFGKQMSWRIKFSSMGGVVCSALVCSIPSTVFYGEVEIVNKETNITGLTCGRYRTTDMSLQLSINVLLMLIATAGITVIVVMYVKVAKKIYQQATFRQQFVSGTQNVLQQVPVMPSTDESCLDSQYGKSNDQLKNTRQHTIHGIKSGGEVRIEKGNVNTSEAKETSVEERDKESKTTMDNSEKINKNTINRKLKFLGIQKGMTFKSYSRQYKYSILFMVISVVFVVSYAPRLVIMIFETVRGNFWSELSDSFSRLCLFFYRFYIVNNIVNPFLYAAFDIRFRQEVKKVLQTVCNV